MLSLPPDLYVLTYFDQRTRHLNPAIRKVILEDVASLLEGNPGEFVEHFEDLRIEFLEVCQAYGVHLARELRR